MGTSSSEGNITLFKSSVLPFADHTLDILVVETGQGRNYSIDYFEVISNLPSTGTSLAKVGAIVGGVLGAFAFLLCLALSYWLWRRRCRRERTSDNPEVVETPKMDEYGTSVLLLKSLCLLSHMTCRH